MNPVRDLVAVTVRPGPDPVPGLDAALSGDGPALLLLPDGPPGGRLAAAMTPLAEDGVPADTALVLATSGSTGEPKGVRIGADALRHAAELTNRHLGGPGQWVLAVPPHRIAGLAVLIRSRTAGTEPVAVDTADGFTPDAFTAATRRLQPGTRHYTALVAAQLRRLLDAGAPLDGFDGILLGGGPVPDGLIERAAAAGTRVLRTYGMTETCGGCIYDGRPLPGVRMMIGPGGLIRITGPVLARGYLGPTPAAPPAPPGPPRAAPGFTGAWFVSSDLGRIDSAGVLHVLGRADDVIVSGGVNIPAQAVETAMADDPSVAAVAVVGRPDPEWGEAVVAAVVPATAAGIDAEGLRGRVAGRLGRSHVPREIRTLSALPLLPSGKVDRAALRAQLVAAAPPPDLPTG